MSEEKYVMVTTTQIIRNRYVTPLSSLTNEDGSQGDPSMAVAKATAGEIPCFSQFGAGEAVIDAQVLTESSIIDLFDADHPDHKEIENSEKIRMITETPAQIEV